MLPPGHAAAGYLDAAGIIQLFPHAVPQSAGQSFLASGFVLGALPDVDMFFAFAKTRSLVIQNDRAPHRAYITHTPIFWAVCSGAFYLFSRDVSTALLLLLCPLSHLILDSLEDEIRWLWPFSQKFYRMKKSPADLALPPQNFFSYWFKFLQWYVHNRTVTATFELCLIVVFFVAVLSSQG